ncbi:Putative CscD cell-surface protein, LPxTG anchor [Latilactobacillus curvatus]|uniref:hypothetical protein n=1 Tax=Latilactobacillus curvatus TaxID=28038 RepID=UPI000A1A5416|nr:hypothetical protein [Latilactobacillus curvatus]SMH68064.1 Putative CscD cell-surface protein, LPxTG anchor [Latilactobacillus curvatus]
MYKLCSFAMLLGGSLLFTPIRADAGPVNPPSIAAPENIDIGQPGLHIILTSLPAEPIGRLPQTDVAPVRPYQLLGLLLLLITILIKKEATFYEKDTY